VVAGSGRAGWDGSGDAVQVRYRRVRRCRGGCLLLLCKPDPRLTPRRREAMAAQSVCAMRAPPSIDNSSPRSSTAPHSAQGAFACGSSAGGLRSRDMVPTGSVSVVPVQITLSVRRECVGRSGRVPEAKRVSPAAAVLRGARLRGARAHYPEMARQCSLGAESTQPVRRPGGGRNGTRLARALSSLVSRSNSTSWPYG
jgi:hypothetical protein